MGFRAEVIHLLWKRNFKQASAERAFLKSQGKKILAIPTTSGWSIALNLRKRRLPAPVVKGTPNWVLKWAMFWSQAADTH